MKRLLFGGLVALGMAVTAAPASADCYFQWNCCHNLTFVRTARNRCWNFSSYVNPLPCISSCGGGGASSAVPYPYPAPAAYAPYGYGYGYGYAPAAVAAAPAGAAPAASSTPAAQPSFRAPQPTPAASTTGLQQAGYSYYGQTTNAGYGYNAGYNYGAGYGYGYYSYAQAPNYWY